MIELIKNILLKTNYISGFKIIETKTEANELFFVKKSLDMNRAKNVHHFVVTVYRDFEEAGKKFRGSSSAKIHPTMTASEIESAITDCAFAAQYVKNEYYPLVQPSEKANWQYEGAFSREPVSNWMPKLTDSIFNSDRYSKGGLNSAELFVNKIYTRIINSEGVDVSFETFKGDLEFITNWQENSEEVELYKRIYFSDYRPEYISEKVEEMINISREKAIAKPTSNLESLNIILSTANVVEEFFSYYYNQANAQSVYNHISGAKLNESIQGNEAVGDLINIELDPGIKGSTYSVPYDDEGFKLSKVTVIENGILKSYWGDTRYCHYLNAKPTGVIKNLIVTGGTGSIDSLKSEPYLELAAFSDFQMDDITGNFGGEIRLGWYFDGKNITPVTGGSISGNIKDIQKNMFLSSELQQNNNFIGPKAILLKGVSIAGCEE